MADIMRNIKLRGQFRTQLNEVRELMMRLPNQYDKIKVGEWLLKLVECDDVAIAMDYAYFLIKVLKTGTLLPPFNSPPPETLQAVSSDFTAENIVQILLEERERQGGYGDRPPIVTEVSSDLKEYAAAQLIPKFGVHCYFAVSDEPLSEWRQAGDSSASMQFLAAASLGKFETGGAAQDARPECRGNISGNECDLCEGTRSFMAEEDFGFRWMDKNPISKYRSLSPEKRAKERADQEANARMQCAVCPVRASSPAAPPRSPTPPPRSPTPPPRSPQSPRTPTPPRATSSPQRPRFQSPGFQAEKLSPITASPYSPASPTTTDSSYSRSVSRQTCSGPSSSSHSQTYSTRSGSPQPTTSPVQTQYVTLRECAMDCSHRTPPGTPESYHAPPYHQPTMSSQASPAQRYFPRPPAPHNYQPSMSIPESAYRSYPSSVKPVCPASMRTPRPATPPAQPVCQSFENAAASLVGLSPESPRSPDSIMSITKRLQKQAAMSAQRQQRARERHLQRTMMSSMASASPPAPEQVSRAVDILAASPGQCPGANDSILSISRRMERKYLGRNVTPPSAPSTPRSRPAQQASLGQSYQGMQMADISSATEPSCPPTCQPPPPSQSQYAEISQGDAIWSSKTERYQGTAFPDEERYHVPQTPMRSQRVQPPPSAHSATAPDAIWSSKTERYQGTVFPDEERYQLPQTPMRSQRVQPPPAYVHSAGAPDLPPPIRTPRMEQRMAGICPGARADSDVEDRFRNTSHFRPKSPERQQYPSPSERAVAQGMAELPPPLYTGTPRRSSQLPACCRRKK